MPSSLTLDDVIERDPEKVSGTCVFRDSRLPVMTLFDNLDAGETVDDFMENYPGVPREYIDIVLLPENRERVAAIVEADRKGRSQGLGSRSWQRKARSPKSYPVRENSFGPRGPAG